ncbi:hypothetical protein BCR41DRAFT_346431 [Lobosporangium transversale]|uniref:Uncharacterized protein n=1 Tax=Lobosporangium transversale TaxID=64571 RepID=A0A1Y2H0F5_9FUNG|nr:hypothetical protein BCR41DRAFT_346431 [Lobosporangium transversale]ORZ28037.1 hypothetical protein BCR41DRAFT_346431 [Lobosporangium transversale]|eukprot:XP_021885740.1 hypothetical protein BCR41DRAFT_346431 [Lobosporangium transversale]
MANFSGADIFLFIVGFFLPPLAVGLKRGCTADFLISIGLTLLGHVPGIGYAWYIVYKYRDEPSEYNRYHGRTYVAVPQQHNYQATAQTAPAHPPVV